jgi:hypothetical protein
MQLWFAWFSAAAQLRPACSRTRTFLWLLVALAAGSLRNDLAGVTSFIRALDLRPSAYPRLLHFFHSGALPLDRLTRTWTALALRLFAPWLVRLQGRLVVVGDGIKRPKEGRHMPAVKSLHQDSQNNSKAAYIMGHSCQALCLLAELGAAAFAVPLACRIHEGIKITARGPTLLDKFIALLHLTGLDQPIYLVADAYYASRKIVLPLLAQGSHLISRLRRNALAYLPPPRPRKHRRRGRPQKYGPKVKLWTLFDSPRRFRKAPSPLPGETGVTIRYYARPLLWRPLALSILVVAVMHPVRGWILVFSTDLSLPPLEVLRLYGRRFKIEVCFKAAIYTLGAFAYHFWLRAMPRLSRGAGDQDLRRVAPSYRRQVSRKLAAYERFMQVGLIAQGLLQYLSLSQPAQVWRCFGSWLRTMNTHHCPSEAVTAQALRRTWPEFLLHSPTAHSWRKFLVPWLAPERCPFFSFFKKAA